MSPDRGENGALGAELRTLRHLRDLSLAEVAEGTAISKSFLSMVESGKSDITWGRLVRLVRFYGISVSDLLPGADVSGSISIVRSGKGTLISSRAEGIHDFLLTSKPKPAMLPLFVVIEPRGENVEPAQHEGEEFVYVFQGSVCLDIGADTVTLDEGDSLYFRADVPHLYANRSDREARLLVVVTPPHV